MPLGAMAVSDNDLLTGYDAEQLQKNTTADGVSFEEVGQEINVALGALNSEIAANHFYASIVSYTDSDTVDYREGNTNGFQQFTEFATGDAERAEMQGHMLPLKSFDRKLSWTWKFLKEANADRLRKDMRAAIDDARHLYRRQILARVFKRGDDTGSTAGLGSTGISTGFATAAANTGVDFTPTNINGTAFTSDHDHYLATAGGAITEAIVRASVKDVREHGHNGNLEMIIGTGNEAEVTAFTNFRPVNNGLVNYGDSAVALTGANEAIGSYIIGVWENVTVRVVGGIPTDYMAVYKSYGANDGRNPLAVRLESGLSAPRFIAMPDPRGGSGAFPMQNMVLYTEMGVGVMDRTNGLAHYVNSGTWTDGVVG